MSKEWNQMGEKPRLQQSWRGKDWKGETSSVRSLEAAILIHFFTKMLVLFFLLQVPSLLYIWEQFKPRKHTRYLPRNQRKMSRDDSQGLIAKIQTDQKPNAIWPTSGRSSNWIKFPLNMISLGLLKPAQRTSLEWAAPETDALSPTLPTGSLINWRLFLSLHCPAENWLSYLWAPGANGLPPPQNTTVTDLSTLLGLYGLIITRRKKKGPWGRQQGTGKL